MIAKSAGGSNDINNLLTSCADCNRGKGARALSALPRKVSENLAVLKEKEEQLKEYNKYLHKSESRMRKDVRDISLKFEELYPGREFTDTFKWVSIKMTRPIFCTNRSESLHRSLGL